MKMRANVCEPILDVYDAIAGAVSRWSRVVQGAALGFGAAMAGACDLTIAADNARFQLPEMEKDLPPTLAISALMARVPRKALAWIVYSMDEIDATTALQLGIVSKVVPLSRSRGAVDEAARHHDRAQPGGAGRGEGFLPRRPVYGPARNCGLWQRNLLAARAYPLRGK